jgi:CubicO group peptidase (beta-lactamase class C family)
MILRHGTPEEVGVSAERIQNVRDIAQDWVEEGIHPSLVVLAARQGVIFLHEAYGRLGPEDGALAVEHNTIFPICSISKPITATAAMILVEEGLLGLNRPVRDYIPEFEGEGKHQVLIRQLLTHTSGLEANALVEQAGDEGIDLEEANLTTWISENLDDYMALICRTPLSKPPDSEMVYDSLNYDLLGEIVRRVAGKGLAVLAEERIFKPLGMEDTFVVVPMEVKDRVVRRPKSAVFYDLTSVSLDVELGSSGACSTAMDMAVFGQMFLNGGTYGGNRILSQASVDAMTRNQIPGIGADIETDFLKEAEWGLGWGVHMTKKTWAWDELLQSQTSFSHSGSGGVMLKVDPTYDMVMAFFSVYLELLENDRPKANTDLFINAVLASIEEL